MKNSFYILLIILIVSVSCASQKKHVFIVTSNDETMPAARELALYLSKTYTDASFKINDKIIEGRENIILKTNPGRNNINDEQYDISGDENILQITGGNSRAIFNGVYGLLKEIGWNFYLSFEVPPLNPKPLIFNEFHLANSPLKNKRIIFNWHNFMSGCSGWDLEQWEKWIDQSSKIGFNTVMVHGYGNNPIQSFSFNGIESETGYLTSTMNGRDNGAQHVNDVRLMHGGKVYTDYVFGAKPSRAKDENRIREAKSLMQEVFKYADHKAMDVCFAIDIDTWMSNPQNIINSLPQESLLHVSGYNVVNPETRDGREYYKARLEELLSDYPEITTLAAWIRNPYIGMNSPVSIWFNFKSDQLPESWQEEYHDILRKNSDYKDTNPFPGLFAISKVLIAFREILDELKPEVELNLGSWRYNICKFADPFIPRFCGLMPLDYDINFGTPEILDNLQEVGKTRKIYPIVWAHHDDHRYLGRPYKPWSNFNDKLDMLNAPGFGIIHWTTHPLDLYFTNTVNQVWENTENNNYDTAINNYTNSLLKQEDESMLLYFQRWFTEAPMFGRETSQDFIPVQNDYQLDGYNSAMEVVEKTQRRIDILKSVNTDALNEQGKREYNYQMGLESFIISFFENHHHLHSAWSFLEEENLSQAINHLNKTNPEETLEKFAGTISEYNATRGEEGVLITLNLQWFPDYIDVKQRAGIEPVRINFQPTSHDPLARGAGKYTFFIDEEGNYWNALGEKELGVQAFTNGNIPLSRMSGSWIDITSKVRIPLQTIRFFSVPKGKYILKLFYMDKEMDSMVKVYENDDLITSGLKDEFMIESNGGELVLEIDPGEKNVLLAGLILRPL